MPRRNGARLDRPRPRRQARQRPHAQASRFQPTPNGNCVRTGKRRFSTRSKAEAAKDRMVTAVRKADPSRPLPKRVYHCRYCSDWHMTSGPR